MSTPHTRRKRKGAALSEPTEKLPRTDSVAEAESASQFAQTYEQLQNAYTDRNPTQQSFLYLKRIASDEVIPPDFKRYPLLRLLSEIAKDMLMNELEVVGWSVYLDRFVWGSDLMHLQTILQFSALEIKSYFGSDLEVVKAHLVRKNQRFLEQFEAWEKVNEGKMKISPKEMNDKFRKLSMFPSQSEVEALVDYNYIVDEILQLSPPYNVGELDGREAISAADDPNREDLPQVKEEPEPNSPESFEPLIISRGGSINSTLEFPSYNNPSILRQASISDVWEQYDLNKARNP